MKIFPKLLLLLSLIAVIPLFIAGFLLLQQSNLMEKDLLSKNAKTGEKTALASQLAVYEQTQDTLLEIVSWNAAWVENYLGNIQKAVLLETALIKQYLVTPASPQAPPLVPANEIARLLETDPDFAQNRYAKTPYSIFHAAPDADKDSSQAMERLRPLGHFFLHNQLELPGSKTTYLGHSKGFIFGYPGKTRFKPEYDARQRSWYRHAREQGRLVWTDLYLDKNGRDLVMTCANPVYSESGSLEAVAAIDVTLGELTRELFDIDTFAARDAILVDDQGLVKVSARYGQNQSSITALSTIDPPHVKKFLKGKYAPVLRLIQGRPKEEWGAALMLSGKPASIDEVIKEGGGSMFAYAKITIPTVEKKDSHWYYILEAPLEHILKPVLNVRENLDASNRELAAGIYESLRRLWRQITAVVAVILILVILAAYATARSASRPLIELARTVERVGHGDLEQKVRIRSRDEIGEVGRAVNEMIQGLKERDFIKGTFKRYVSASVVEQLLREPDKIRLGGEKKELTVFFSDLSGFTGISEKLKPEELVELINEYLSAMTEAILSEEGTLDKYQGDAIMAFWGAPIHQDNHALRACKAALKNLALLKELWPQWKERGLPRLDMRIGINTGAMVVGNMGSSLRMDYTVMGDSVNLGSRLEGVNKVYGTRILISETARLAAGPSIAVREIDLIAVKGKEKPVKIFELAGLAGALDERLEEGLRTYEEGLLRYRARDWKEAAALFQKTDEILGGDPAARVLIQRTREFMSTPPPQAWSGVFTLTSK